MGNLLRKVPDVPAPVALAVFFALGAAMVLSDLRAFGLVLLAAWGGYCIAHPSAGWALFFLPAAQSVAAQLADWVNEGAYWYVYAALVPLALMAAQAHDEPIARRLRTD